MRKIIKRAIELQEQIEYTNKVLNEFADEILTNSNLQLPDALNRVGDALSEARANARIVDRWIAEKVIEATNG